MCCYKCSERKERKNRLLRERERNAAEQLRVQQELQQQHEQEVQQTMNDISGKAQSIPEFRQSNMNEVPSAPPPDEFNDGAVYK
jgi:hypothetical protein